MTIMTLGDENADASGVRHSQCLRYDLVRRLLGAMQDDAAVPHAEVLAAAWSEAARSRRPLEPTEAAVPRAP